MTRPRAVLLRDNVDRLIDGWQRERQDLDIEPAAVVYRVQRLASFFSDEVDSVFRRLGVTRTDFGVLANLRRSGAPYQLTQRELMDSMLLTSGTISVRIDRLVDDGLVRREPDPSDGRSVLVTLTEAGGEVFDRVAPEHLANEACLLAALTADEREQLSRLLRRVLLEFEQPTEGRPDHRLGVQLTPAHVAQERRAQVGLAPARGVLVEAVYAGTPAQEAGLKPGDLLVRAGDRELCSLDCLAQALDATDDLRLSVRRGDDAFEVTVRPLPIDRPVGPPAPPRTRRR